MRDALLGSDQELYFKLLSLTQVLLPVSPDAPVGRAPMGWGTWTQGSRTHVLGFTSTAALYACMPRHAGSFRQIGVAGARRGVAESRLVARDQSGPADRVVPAGVVPLPADPG